MIFEIFGLEQGPRNILRERVYIADNYGEIILRVETWVSQHYIFDYFSDILLPVMYVRCAWFYKWVRMNSAWNVCEAPLL